ncbi:Septin-domain-containing protein [Podospora fimiseda]|uniref:Septin-domain-containing protein n=1 Tax=Podospora fimiseda TaxID=252190 RepID=A0AAN7H7X9_9PEZI|nr:Septin-domain-containing protein [Podospora fimiseda]
MHFATMVHNATKGRTKSVQFEKSMLSLDTNDGASSRDGASSPPIPGVRTSSLPMGAESKENINITAIRHYKSMLDIEEPPRLPIAKPMSYDELYPKPNDPILVHRYPPRRPFVDTSLGIPTSPPPPSRPSPIPGQASPSGSDSIEGPSDFIPAASPATNDDRNIVRRKLTGYVGFANLPNQWHRKSVRKGFNFNVMVVGESGLGKSTLVNTLFNTSLYPPKERKGPSLDILPKTVTIQSISADIEEAGVRLRLTVVDTPGFGDFVNNDESWRPIVDNIEQRFDAYLDAENKVNRMNIVDNRIHACVFFIQPTGHSLKPLDIEVMKRLHTKVNLIPVIAKADTLTDDEVAAFKARILADIAYHKIQIFEGPRYELDDEETIAENNEIMSKVPFAVVGANTEVTNPDGRRVRGRAYPWGVIEVDNEEHCDFVKLRQMLIRTHMEELKENTNNALYENYRTDKLIAMGVSQDPSVFKEVNPAVKQEEERALHEQKLAKMEAEMKMVFQQKVAEKESKLKQSEEELYARHREMKEQLERQRLELEEKKARVESGRPLEKEPKRKGFSLR